MEKNTDYFAKLPIESNERRFVKAIIRLSCKVFGLSYSRIESLFNIELKKYDKGNKGYLDNTDIERLVETEIGANSLK